MVFAKRSLLSLLFCLFVLFSKAQLQPVYVFQQDDTVLRNNYYEEALQKKKYVFASLGKEHADDYKRAYTEQFKEIFELWQSSRPVTAPEANDYLQSIVKKIIAANPELEGTDIRVVFCRDWWPNAYSMGDGTITVNAGLLVFLENEAQLVFALCHELAHYYLNHSETTIRKYVERINSQEVQAELKRLSKEEYRVNQQLETLVKGLVFDSRRHNRENEAAADRQAFIFMKHTGYDCNAIRTCLELLDKVDDSLLNKPIQLQTLFNFNEYPFRNKWVQKESSIFSQLDEHDSPLTEKEKDSLKSHPDCYKRILLLTDSIRGIQPGAAFLVNEDLFKKLKKDFFIEMSEECYKTDYISRNLYYSLGMLQANDHLPLAVYTVARDLNRIYEGQRLHHLGLLVDTETRGYPEDYNLLLRMLGRLRLDEIADLNYYFCRHYQEQMKSYEGFEKEMNKAAKYRN